MWNVDDARCESGKQNHIPEFSGQIGPKRWSSVTDKAVISPLGSSLHRWTWARVDCCGNAEECFHWQSKHKIKMWNRFSWNNKGWICGWTDRQGDRWADWMMMEGKKPPSASSFLYWCTWLVLGRWLTAKMPGFYASWLYAYLYICYYKQQWKIVLFFKISKHDVKAGLKFVRLLILW